MSRNSDPDRRQQDFFGVPEAEPKLPPAKVPGPQSPSRPARGRRRKEAKPPNGDGREDDGIERQLARLSPAELRQLAAILPDEALAQLLLAAVRQLKRRLVQVGRGGSRAGTSVLERAVRQLVAELGDQGGDEEEF